MSKPLSDNSLLDFSEIIENEVQFDGQLKDGCNVFKTYNWY